MVGKYTYFVQYSEEDECYIAFVVEIPTVTGDGETPEEAIAEARDYLKFMMNDSVFSLCVPPANPMENWDDRSKVVRREEA
jgi:predicted RNase H-like HicB family nuclease